MTTPPTPGLQLLGSVCWHGPGGERIAFDGERRFQLLALLACQEATLPRSQLADWLWPERDAADARRNLRKVLLHARRLCAELPQAPPLALQGDLLRWQPATDLRGFLDACHAQDHARAVRAYRPGLLAGLEAGLGDDALAWLARRRAWLDERWHAAARQWLGGLRHEPQAQADAAEQVLARDPLDEAALRTLLGACAALGERTRGLRALHAYAERLRRELDAAPSPELAALGQALHAAPAPLVTPRVRGTPARAVQGIVEAAMDTVADATEWPVLLRRLTQAAHGLGSMIVGCNVVRVQDGVLFQHGLDAALGEHFLMNHQDNLRTRTMVPLRPGHVIDPLLVAGPALLRTAFHEEILLPQRIVAAAAMSLPMDAQFIAGGVSIEFSGAHARERAAQAIPVLEHLAPYLQRAAAALMRWHRLPSAETLAAGLDLLPGAVLILSARGRVLFANAPAEALLAAADALCLREDRLAAARPADAPQLDALLAQAAQAPGPLATLRAQLRLRRSAGRPALQVSVMPMRDGQDRLQLRGRAAVLVLADEMAESPPKLSFS
ncbi:MAG: BTAD domain-containing putative transcriptional regulator [Ottowia sp.]|uniref:AfsR/SARP family transcriptional regulator n=1 Tax=Ottowia sp. TaxID=1898956 RepID=UPI0039E34BDC